MDDKVIYPFIFHLRMLLNDILVEGGTMSIKAYKCPKVVAIKILFQKGGTNNDEIITMNSFTDIYNELGMKKFIYTDNPEGLIFKGTNVIINGNELILLKDYNIEDWTIEAAKETYKYFLDSLPNGN